MARTVTTPSLELLLRQGVVDVEMVPLPEGASGR
jgi:hypothetical protein